MSPTVLKSSFFPKWFANAINFLSFIRLKKKGSKRIKLTIKALERVECKFEARNRR